MLTTATFEPAESSVPKITSLIIKSILFPARKTIFVPALNSATPKPLTLNESPVSFPCTAKSPVTVPLPFIVNSVAVVVCKEVVPVAVKFAKVASTATALFTVIVPFTLPVELP